MKVPRVFTYFAALEWAVKQLSLLSTLLMDELPLFISAFLHSIKESNDIPIFCEQIFKVGLYENMHGRKCASPAENLP